MAGHRKETTITEKIKDFIESSGQTFQSFKDQVMPMINGFLAIPTNRAPTERLAPKVELSSSTASTAA